MNELSLELSSDLNVLSAEINSYKQIAGQAVFEIGKRLNHVKENDLAHGQFIPWLETIGMSYTSANQFMKVAKELNVGTCIDLGSRALYLIATMPEGEREKEHKLPSGETKTVDEMTVRELQEVKRQLKAERERNKQQAETIAELVNVEPEVIEKVVEVVPADYQQVKRSNESLANELERYQRKADELEKSIADIDNRNKFIEKQYQEVLNDRKEDLERKDKLEAFENEMERLTRRKDKYSQQLKAIGDISKMNFDVGKLLEKISPFYYQIYLKDVVEDDVIHDSISKMVGSVRKWCDDMDSVLGNAKIIEGEIING